jgi:hypothetical protein
MSAANWLATTPVAPREEPVPTPTEVRVSDAVAEKHGFVSREPAPVRRRRWAPVDEPLAQLNVRCAVRDINDFVTMCDREAISYREGFGRLMALVRKERGTA